MNINWPEECNEYPPLPDRISSADRIVAIGDVHGDWDFTIHILQNIAKVIKIKETENSCKISWVAEPKNTIVVQLGDQIDSCRSDACRMQKQQNDKAEDVKILKFFTYLHKLARREGGAVYSLLGNHETMNVQGNTAFVSYENMHAFDGNPNNRIKVFRPGGEMAKFMACTRQSALIIGSWLFMHAGLTKQLAEKYSITELNDVVRRWMLNLLTPENINEILSSEREGDSPFWNRLFGDVIDNIKKNNGDYTNKCKELLDGLETWDVSNLVVGHNIQKLQPDNNFINSVCSRKIWRIDTGASRSFQEHAQTNEGRRPQIIEIIDDKHVNILG
uniref:Calcineurin-like phosphoesterase domain-containing protein n=1 Tax=Megaviridae environmental sample TaxID=1737588 RepID=A0A5J6VIW2_9VIRU|nr:MAG: hypothetical protein [Megaviridae environmental sample]